ncbi:MAG: hypothetical protein ISR65_14005 [Bacteriovoracaceae bacterium]|nr:hypothetical protein [Bacteriovoracaceae bacterium]
MKTYLTLLMFIFSLSPLFISQTAAKMNGKRAFKIGGDNIFLWVPNNWQTAKNLFGLPLSVLGPSKFGGRPIISITPTTITKIQLDPQDLKNDQSKYRQGRQKWLDKMKGKLIKYYPYKRVVWENMTSVDQIGFRYRLSKGEFVEFSYFAICNKELFHIKTLNRVKHEKVYRATIDKILKSISCIPKLL